MPCFLQYLRGVIIFDYLFDKSLLVIIYILLYVILLRLIMMSLWDQLKLYDINLMGTLNIPLCYPFQFFGKNIFKTGFFSGNVRALENWGFETLVTGLNPGSVKAKWKIFVNFLDIQKASSTFSLSNSLSLWDHLRRSISSWKKQGFWDTQGRNYCLTVVSLLLFKIKLII